MEENELEEGEAYSGPEDHAAIDALSYIDEKIKNVLGHFQKEFEGGLCAENLGAKFGGYGSFLPVHQRSPVIIPHSKSPQKSSNYINSKSPNNAQFEGQGPPQKLDAATIPSVSLRKNSFCVEQQPDILSKKVTCQSTSDTEEHNSQHGYFRKQTNSNDQNIPMVHVKMGSEKGLVRNNADIYSGLGLDVSPSSSLEDITDGSLYSSPKSQDAPIDSPMMIFQLYTCFRLSPNDSIIHSPIPKTLLNLLEKVQSTDCKMVDDFFSHGNSTMPSGEIPPKRNVKRSFEKISKLVGKNCKSTEMEMMKSKAESNDISVLFDKEIDIETSVGRELNTSTDSLSNDEEAFKGASTKWGPQVVMGKDQNLPADLIQDKPESVTSLDASKLGNGRTVSSHIESKSSMKPLQIDNNLLEDRRGNVLKDDAAVDPQNIWKVTEHEGYKVSKDRFVAPSESVLLKAPQRAVSCEQDGDEIRKYKEKASSGKRKPMESQSQTTGTPSSDFSKEYPNIIGSALKKDKKKKIHPKADQSDCKSKALKSQRDSDTILVREYHTNSSILTKKEQVGKTDEHELFSREKQKDHKFEYNKDDSFLAQKIIEKPGRQSCENLPVSEQSNMVTSSSNPLGVETFSTVPPPSAHVIKENWVCCDRCSKWRLLPYGTDTSHLPQKWVCSMLTWLPGMNKCSITEEETTKAFHALYQLPFPMLVTNGHRDAANSGVVIADSQHLQNNHDSGEHAVFSIAKKRPKTMDVIPLPPGQLTLVQTTKHLRENQEFPMQSRSLGDMKSNVLNKSGCNESMLADIAVENQNNKQREKKKVVDRFSDGGVSEQNDKAKSKRRKEFDQNSSRTSKKVEMHESLFSDVDCPSNHDTGEMPRTNINNGFPSKTFAKSSKDSNFGSKRASPAVRQTMKAPVHATTSGEMNLEKLKENVSHHRTIDFKEESSETEHRNKKKMRISKSDGQELNANTFEIQADKNNQSMRIHLSKKNQIFDGITESRTYNNKDHRHHLSHRNADGIDSLKKDYSCIQPSTAATSSSSKVSSSRKSKANFQEAKDSPVESVSSSPFRNLGKDDLINVGYPMMGSPRRFSDGEADGACNSFGSKQNGSMDVMKRGAIQIKEAGSYASNSKDLFKRIFGCTDDEPTPSEYNDIIRGDGAMLNRDQQKKCNIKHRRKSHDIEQDKFDIGVNANEFKSNKRSGTSSSSRSRERGKHSKIDKGNMKASDEFSDHENFNNEKYNRYEAAGSCDQSTCHGDSNLEKKERKNYPKIDGGRLSEGKRNKYSNSKSQENLDVHVSSLQANKNCNSLVTKSVGYGEKSHSQENHHMILPQEREQSLNHVFSDRMDKLELNSGRVKSEKFQHSSEKQDSKAMTSRFVKMKVNGSRSEVMSVKTENLDANNVLKQPIKIGLPNGANNNSLKQHTPNRLDGPGHIRKGVQDKIVMKEARGLKHSANRLKEFGSELESTDMYFQAALKFLHVALLQEPSIQMYSETAKLCEYCAHEYEKHKKMAAASLAYKCMEVAYMKVVYSKHSGTSKDFQELLHGESPSSSASDVDNLNNSSFLNKTHSVKKVNSQITGNHVISACNRPNFGRLLGFTGNVNSAMEASKKSLNAFAAASIEGIGVEALSSVKKVLDFSFHDVEGLLRLVRLSVELIMGNSS